MIGNFKILLILLLTAYGCQANSDNWSSWSQCVNGVRSKTRIRTLQEIVFDSTGCDYDGGTGGTPQKCNFYV